MNDITTTLPVENAPEEMTAMRAAFASVTSKPTDTADSTCIQNTAEQSDDFFVVEAINAIELVTDAPVTQSDDAGENGFSDGTGESIHPAPDDVLDKVEERMGETRQRSRRRQENAPGAASGEKLNALAAHYKKPNKGRAALFDLPADRPASQLLKNIFDPSTIEGKDGVDHINIHNNAETELGRFLDMNAHSPFVHPDAGNFQSVGGLWHYIQTRPLMEEFRIASGARVRTMAKKMKDEAMSNQNAPRHTPIKGFRTIIADAMWHKVTQSANAVRMMAESTLPFEHYFTQGELNIRQYPSEGYWIVAAYEEIRRVIKHRLATGDTEAQPNFSSIETMVDTRSPSQNRNQGRRDNPYGNRPRHQPRR
jgi:hypothetical protein